MKLLLITILVLLPCTGCTGLSRIARQLKDDPAVVKLNVVTLYGSGILVRVGNNTNSVTIDPDGTVRINERK